MFQRKGKMIAALMAAVMLFALLSVNSLASGEASSTTGASSITNTNTPEHTFRLQPDSYEATAATGGYRHYRCTECGEEYSYTIDPLVYDVNPKTGEPLDDSLAVNPYLPNYEFMPDNELHVFWSKEDSEWRVYAVGSHDTGLSGWCGNDIVCWSAPVYDLSDWRFEAILRDTGVFFACDFNYDLQTDWCILYTAPFISNSESMGTHLWINEHSVPDAYFDIPLNADTGVVGLDGLPHFDPAIYIAADGSILCTYDETTDGTKHAELAKVNSNDRTQVEWTAPVVMAENERNTNGYNPKEYEASTIDYVTVDGHSYYVIQYSYQSNLSDDDYEKDVNGENRWWPLAYVYSDPDMEIDELKDFTGWHWGGFIGDNGGFLRRDAGSDTVTEHDDPVNCWGNNHGGLVEINGQWYISNHRHTSNGAGRQGFLEKVTITTNGDGGLHISPAEYTSSIGDSIDAYRIWPASIACHLWPTVFSETSMQTMYIESPLRGSPDNYWEFIYDIPEYAEHRSPIVGIKNGAEIGFKYLDFGSKDVLTDLSVLVSQGDGYADGEIAVYLDAPNAEEGKRIGVISISADAVDVAGIDVIGSDGTQWSWLKAAMEEPVSGVHAVYFVFSSEGDGDICKLDAFAFEHS